MHPSALRILLPLCLFLLVGCDSAPSGALSASKTPGNSARSTSAANLLWGSAPTAPPETTVATPDQMAATTRVRELDWDALIPADWNPNDLMDRYNDLKEQYGAGNLSDTDPKARELSKKMKRLWDEAPVVKALNGQRVKLPGFVVPLEMNARSISEFLLVPYYGACIHVPPPPTNQTVYVIAPSGKPFEGKLFDTVWVTGEIRVENYSHDAGDAGYSIHASKIEPYQ